MSFDSQAKRYSLLHLIGLKHLRIERAEQIRIPGARLIFIVFDVQEAVCSVWSSLVMTKGPSQAGASLCGLC